MGLFLCMEAYQKKEYENSTKKMAVPFGGASAKQIPNKIPALDLEETIRGKNLETGLPSPFPAWTKPS